LFDSHWSADWTRGSPVGRPESRYVQMPDEVMGDVDG